MNLLTKDVKLQVLTNNVLSLLAAKHGGKPNISDMQKNIGITYKAAYELAHNQSNTIRLSTLDNLCKYFGVGPSEIFIYTPDKK